MNHAFAVIQHVSWLPKVMPLESIHYERLLSTAGHADMLICRSAFAADARKLEYTGVRIFITILIGIIFGTLFKDQVGSRLTSNCDRMGGMPTCPLAAEFGTLPHKTNAPDTVIGMQAILQKDTS